LNIFKNTLTNVFQSSNQGAVHAILQGANHDQLR
jgi:hypothetical protein